MRAKEYVQQLRRLEYLIKNKQLEICQLKNTVISPKSMQYNRLNVQTTRNYDKMADIICSYADIEKELQEEILKYYQKRVEIIHTIELLPFIQYNLLHKVYVQGKNLQEVAIELDKSYTWVTTTQNRAFKALQKLLDESEEV